MLFAVCVFFARVKAEGLILSLKPSRDSDQLHHLPSPLQSKSRCSSCAPVSLSLTPSARTLLCTSYPQKLDPSRSLYSIPSRCILFIFVYTRHLSSSLSRFYRAHLLGNHPPPFLLLFLALSQTVGFKQRCGKGREGHF